MTALDMCIDTENAAVARLAEDHRSFLGVAECKSNWCFASRSAPENPARRRPAAAQVYPLFSSSRRYRREFASYQGIPRLLTYIHSGDSSSERRASRARDLMAIESTPHCVEIK